MQDNLRKDDIQNEMMGYDTHLPFSGRLPSQLTGQLTEMRRNWGWVLVAGIAYVIVGIIAFSWPITSTIGVTFGLGVLLMVSGVVQGIHAIHLRKVTGNAWRALLSLVALVAGLLMLRYPGAGMIGVAIALTFFFFVSAGAKWVVAATLYPEKGWGWTFMSAFASFVLGAYILMTFPISALWVPAVVLGIDLVIMGSCLIGLSFNLRKIPKSLEEKPEYPSESKRVA